MGDGADLTFTALYVAKLMMLASKLALNARQQELTAIDVAQREAQARRTAAGRLPQFASRPA